MTTRTRKAAATAAADQPDQDVELTASGDELEQRNGASRPAPITSLADLKHAFEAEDRPIKRVTVSEWPGHPTFYLRGLTGTARDEMEIAMSRVLSGTQYVFFDNAAAQIVARALCTPEGAPLVPKEKLPEVVAQLGARQAGGLLKLQRVAQALSGLSDSSIEELVDDLKDDPSADSGTG